VPTQSERKALLFFASVALLGAGWRVVRASGIPEPGAEERAALHAQIAAVDSVRSARHRQPRASSSSRKAPVARQTRAPREPPPLIDIDEATAEELEALPRIGPALAKRIVEDREANGPFGSLDALQRVKGIGPAMAKTLAPRVTFSTSRRPTDASTYRPLAVPQSWPATPPSNRNS
jgi:competence protein ComEA